MERGKDENESEKEKGGVGTNESRKNGGRNERRKIKREEGIDGVKKKNWRE